MPKIPDGYHHMHVLVPQELMIRFRRHFPLKGGMSHGVIMAMEALLKLLERTEDTALTLPKE
jgi:hypothetical protein